MGNDSRRRIGVLRNMFVKSDPEFMDLVLVMETQDIPFGVVTSSEYFPLAVLLAISIFFLRAQDIGLGVFMSSEYFPASCSAEQFQFSVMKMVFPFSYFL